MTFFFRIMLVDLSEHEDSTQSPQLKSLLRLILVLDQAESDLSIDANGILYQQIVEEGHNKASDLLRQIRHEALRQAEVNRYRMFTTFDTIPKDVQTSPPRDCVDIEMSSANNSENADRQPMNALLPFENTINDRRRLAGASLHLHLDDTAQSQLNLPEYATTTTDDQGLKHLQDCIIPAGHQHQLQEIQSSESDRSQPVENVAQNHWSGSQGNNGSDWFTESSHEASVADSSHTTLDIFSPSIVVSTTAEDINTSVLESIFGSDWS